MYVIDETGEFAVKRKINLGRQNPEVFEVLAGLQAGEKVITSSYDNFGDYEKLICSGYECGCGECADEIQDAVVGCSLNGWGDHIQC